MKIMVLGAAAGGGLPQWNCGCRYCCDARSGRIPSMTQSSIAISQDGKEWAIVNASPDLRSQISGSPRLWPKGARESPIVSVLLTNGDIDHVAGLLTMREKQPFRLLATGGIHEVLAANPVFAALDPSLVRRETITMETAFDLVDGVEATAFSVPGKVPLYMEGEEVRTDLEGEQTVGVEFRCGTTRVCHVPGCARVTPRLAERLRGADVLLFDGTLWTDDEMIRMGLGQKTGARMGHLSISGPDGSIAALDGLGIRRKIFIHINNTNPIVDPDSPEAAVVRAAGWEIARDGLEITA